MLYFILIILLVLSLLFFQKGKMAEMLICMTALGNNLFQFGSMLEGSVKIWDIAIITNFCLLALSYGKDKHLFSTRGDKLSSIILILFGYITINFIFTVALGIDTFIYAFKTYRPYTILLFYFVIRKIPLIEYEHYIKLLLKFSILQGIFFYLQLVGITGVLGGYTKDIGTNSARFGNYPFCFDFFILYFIFKENISLPKRLAMLFFFGMMPVIGQMRGAILAICAAFIYYLVIQRKVKNVIYLIIGIVAYQTVISPVFEQRDLGRSVSTKDEILMVLSNPADVYQLYSTEGITGNFTFRIATLTERILYLEENPQYAPFGVGCIFEDSPNNRFNFLLGTYSSAQDYIGQLYSADIAWVCVVMHFGFVGVILFLLLLFVRFYQSHLYILKSQDIIFSTFALQTIVVFILSFDSENLGRLGPLLYMCISCAYIHLYTKQIK